MTDRGSWLLACIALFGDYTDIDMSEFKEKDYESQEKERKDCELWNAIMETAKECGCRGDDVTFTAIKTLKKLGRYDMLPPCEREEVNSND